jgi:energy-coupling factor transporter transmembrane protein EcfT
MEKKTVAKKKATPVVAKKKFKTQDWAVIVVIALIFLSVYVTKL